MMKHQKGAKPPKHLGRGLNQVNKCSKSESEKDTKTKRKSSKATKKNEKEKSDEESESGSESGSGSDSDDKSQDSKTEVTVKLENDDPVEREKERIQEQLDILQTKTNDQIFEEILDFLECHDPAAYRKKIKGFRLAFNIREK